MPDCYSRWGYVGILVWWCLRPTKWKRYKQSLKRQLQERGPIPADVWQTPLRKSIARDIEIILGEACWGEHLSFHPEDPWSVIGEWEISDLSELDAVFRIEKKFGLTLPKKELAERVTAGVTFGDLVTIVEKRGTRLPR